jgi:hypothetical protein
MRSGMNIVERFGLGIALVLIALCLCVIVAAPVQAQEVRSAVIAFERPTHYVDDLPIPASAVLTYAVYQGARGGTKTRVGTITSTGTTITSGLLPGETCWQVTATANGVESARSNEACKTFAFPATQTVTITVR